MLIRIFLRLVLMPVALALTILKWLCAFVLHCSGWIFRLLAMIFFLTAIGSYAFGLEGGREVLRMLGVAFLVFLIPAIAGWITIGIATADAWLKMVIYGR